MVALKLTKYEERFSMDKRPVVGSVVEFSPIIFLTITVYKSDKRAFIKPYMVNGAKCKVLFNTKYLTFVHFLDNPNKLQLDCVSPDFLITRELTDIAKNAISKIKEKAI